MLQVPWFVALSIARVRMGGTSALPAVRRIDALMPLPACTGLLLAVVLLWQRGGSGGVWLWSGAVACAGLCAVFARLMASER